MAIELRTVGALVAAANAATSPADREQYLSAACAQAATFHHWQTILEGGAALVSADRFAQLLALAMAWARTEEDVWGMRIVAAAQARSLGRPDAARETLREGERMLVALGERGESLGFYWGVLADGFNALGDDAEVSRVLEIGWELAFRQRDVENLGRLANKWAALLDPGEAAIRLLRVEQAARGWGNLGGLVSWWRALGDVAAARRVRQATLETTSRFDEALDLARHWRTSANDASDLDAVGAAFAKAESLAATAADWFDLAEAARAVPGCGALARGALDRAAAAVDGAHLRARIAYAYIEWFDDGAAAAALGPRGIRPDDLRQVQLRLEGWEGSASGLFDWLRARVTREQLVRISQADYGPDPAHLAALEHIVASGLVPVELPWHPGEVVALTRWSEGPDVHHLERALSCVLLCLGAPDDELANTAAPLVESLLALGAEAASLGERLMVWRWETANEGDDRFVALLALCILVAAADEKDPRMEALLRRLDAADARGLAECLAGSLRAEMWARLIARALLPWRGGDHQHGRR